MTKRLIALLLALTMALSLAACGGKADTEATEAALAAPQRITENAVYRTLYASEVTTMNYLVTSQTNEWVVAINTVDCLVEYDSYGNVLPALAESWEANADNTVWIFKIRQGVKWVDKNGNEVAEVTAHDWVSSAHYACDASNLSDNVYTMEGTVKNAEAYLAWTSYQMALKSATDGTDENGNLCKVITNEDGEEEILEEVAEVAIEDIGVKALDDYTLEFTLEKPVPYFISMLSYGPYLPVYGPFLDQCGDKFGTDADNLLSCGAFVLSEFEPQQKRVLTKNDKYWDVEDVHLDAIEMTYNAEAGSISASMYLSGDVDQADIDNNKLSAMLEDPQYKDLIHPTRSGTDYSYWYLFNFNPTFDEKYEPDNWNIAVNNENFRKSIYAGLNRVPALATQDRADPVSLKNNTITPLGFCVAEKDYVYYGDLAGYTNGDNYDEAKALEYKEAAIQELTAAGATFPVKVLMKYNPATSQAEEYQVVKQNLETLLGTDYIEIIIEAGAETSFNNNVRKTGDYGFMKCNWGADYVDPETWTDPFAITDKKYNFIELSTSEETRKLFAKYVELVNAAKDITDDLNARYEAFAKAEAFLLDHAFAQPIHLSSRSYQMCDLNLFEGQYSSAGQVNSRYKGQYLYDRSMSVAEYQEAYTAWMAGMAG